MNIKHVFHLGFALWVGLSAPHARAQFEGTRAFQIIEVLKADTEARGTLEEASRLLSISNVDDWAFQLRGCHQTGITHPPHSAKRIRSLFKNIRDELHAHVREAEIQASLQSGERIISQTQHESWMEAWVLDSGGLCFPEQGSVAEAAGSVLHQLLHITSDASYLSPESFTHFGSISAYLNDRIHGSSGEISIYEKQRRFLERHGSESLIHFSEETPRSIQEFATSYYLEHYQSEYQRIHDFYRQQFGTLINFLNRLDIAFENAGFSNQAPQRAQLHQDSTESNERLRLLSR